MAIQYPLRNQRDLRVYYYGDSKDDRSPYGQTGTLVGTASVGSGYLELDGDSDYLTFPDVVSNSLFSSNELTLFAWFNVDTLDAVDQHLISKYDIGDNNRSYALFIDATTGVIQSILSSDGSTLSSDLSTTDTISTGTDYFIVVTWNGVLHRIYINGVEKVSNFYDDGIYDGDELISIGASFDTTAQDFFDGTIYQAGIAGRAFSSQQIQSLYLLGKDYRIIGPNKELLFYEDFSAGKVSDDWLVSSGSFVVEYDSDSGEYYLECLSAGVIGIPTPEAIQDLTKGGFEWEWDMFKGADGNTSNVSFTANSIAAAPTGYRIVFDSSEAIILNETGVGDLGKTGNSYINNTTWYTLRVTRSQDTTGQFTMYLDDALVDVSGGSGTNPATDTTYTTTKYLVMDLDAGDRVKNIRVRRF